MWEKREENNLLRGQGAYVWKAESEKEKGGEEEGNKVGNTLVPKCT